MSRDPGGYAGYAFDLDGTVYLGDALLPGAAEAIAGLRDRGARVVFVTNKPLEPGAAYAEKLTRLGVPAVPEDVVTATDSAVAYLQAHHPGTRLLLLAEGTVAAAVTAAGHEVVTDPARADVVLVSFDRGFDYAKLHAAYRAVVHHGATIVATNPDPTCPTPDGGLPDCAAMLAALEACTGARAAAVLGKPGATMAALVLERLGLPAADVAVVGDRLLTDVAMGQRIGAAGVLVLTGATTAADLAAAGVRPDHVLQGLHQLIPTPAGASTP